MKTTLTDNKQLFNVKAIAAAGLTPDAIPDDQFGIIDESVNKTVVPVSFQALPTNIRLISKMDDKVYYSFDSININKIFKQKAKKYQAGGINIWKITPEIPDCTREIMLNINIDEDSLIRSKGLTWTDKDFVVIVSSEELKSVCKCSEQETINQNIIVKLLYDKITANKSPFYKAVVEDEDGHILATSAAIQTFIDINKKVNTDKDKTNDKKLVLFIDGKTQKAGKYADLEVNYIYPRGVKLRPSLTIDGNKTIPFEEEQELSFEIGAGYDMRAEEFECMSLYNDLNFYTQLSDGIASPKLTYQFENDKKYDTLSFEFESEKTGLGDRGENKRFSIILGSETGTNIHDTLVKMFI